LRLRSRPGRGSVFTIELPPAGAELSAGDAPLPAPAAAANAWTDGAVLIVEDDPEVRAATAARLRGWGATVQEAGSLAEARARLASADVPPALVLLDMQLPDGLGTALRGPLRGPDGRARVPIIWVTADPRVDCEDGEIVLHKPVTALKLRSALDAARRARAPATAGG
jgi:DNA-binding response OmpR family regulator